MEMTGGIKKDRIKEEYSAKEAGVGDNHQQE